MRDEVLEKMRKYLVENLDGDDILSDKANKKMIDMETMQKDPALFRQFMEDVKAWSDESKRGLVCGIFGCTNPPDMVCRTCGCSYCEIDTANHFHSDTNIGLIDDKDLVR